MHTFKHLYPQITSFENLFTARGKRKKADVAEFEFDLEENLLQLEQELITHTYQPGPYPSRKEQENAHKIS